MLAGSRRSSLTALMEANSVQGGLRNTSHGRHFWISFSPSSLWSARRKVRSKLPPVGGPLEPSWEETAAIRGAEKTSANSRPQESEPDTLPRPRRP
eukprot:5316827-Pyramimonas_sp.AAC.1